MRTWFVANMFFQPRKPGRMNVYMLWDVLHFYSLGLFPTFRLFLLYVAVEWKIELLKMIVKFVVSM